MKYKTVTIIGSTGLIGNCLLSELIQDNEIKTIQIIVRRNLSNLHPKVKSFVIDFSDREAFKNAIAGSDAVFCAVGTTQKKVKGDKEAYRKVDYDIPVTAAKLSIECGVPQFLLISSVGATSSSNNFYLKLKGEVEDAVTKLNIPSVSIFRPSMLLGKRSEFRLVERIGQTIMKWISILIPSKYKAIQSSVVAKSMLTAFKKNQMGVSIFHYNEMMG